MAAVRLNEWARGGLTTQAVLEVLYNMTGSSIGLWFERTKALATSFRQLSDQMG